MTAEGAPRRGRTSLLRRNPAFRRLWAARAISHVGDGAALVALLLYVRATRQSGVAVGGLLLARSVPRVLGPLLGALADRVEQRRLLVVCDLGQAALFGLIAWLRPGYVPLLALIVAASILEATFTPAGRSAIPALVGPTDLVQGNAWMGTAFNLQVAIGPAVGGVLVAAFGTRWALAANAASFLISALLLVGLPSLQTAEERSPQGFLAVGREGLRYAWRNPVVRAVLISLFLGVAFAALDNVALVFLARDVFGAGAVGFGILAAAFGVGMMASSLGLSWLQRSFAAASLFLFGWLASGVGTLLTGLAPVIAVAILTQVVAGLGNGVENIAGDTLVQQTVPRQMLGRMFGLMSTAAFGGGTIAYAVGGVLLDLTSPRVVFVVSGAGVLLVFAFLALLLARTVPRTSEAPARVPVEGRGFP